jgi:hypothetical protein
MRSEIPEISENQLENCGKILLKFTNHQAYTIDENFPG